MTRRVLSGTAAARGSALGRARGRLPPALDGAEARIPAGEVDAELDRIHAAVETVRKEMHTLRERLHGALAHEVGGFLDLHALLLDDPELLQGIDALIRTGLTEEGFVLRFRDLGGGRHLSGHLLLQCYGAPVKFCTASFDRGRLRTRHGRCHPGPGCHLCVVRPPGPFDHTPSF